MSILNPRTPLQSATLQFLTDEYDAQAKTSLSTEQHSELNLRNQLDARTDSASRATAAEIVTAVAILSPEQLNSMMPQFTELVAQAANT